MNLVARSTTYFVIGLFTAVISLYLLHGTVIFWVEDHDPVATVCGVLAFAGLTAVTGVHFALAFAYRFGKVESVTGQRDRATLEGPSTTIAANVKIIFIGRPDASDFATHPGHCVVFFVAAGRPWVCPADKFLV